MLLLEACVWCIFLLKNKNTNQKKLRSKHFHSAFSDMFYECYFITHLYNIESHPVKLFIIYSVAFPRNRELHSIGCCWGFSYNVLIALCDSMRLNYTFKQSLMSPATWFCLDNVEMHSYAKSTQHVFVSRGYNEKMEDRHEKKAEKYSNCIHLKGNLQREEIVIPGKSCRDGWEGEYHPQPNCIPMGSLVTMKHSHQFSVYHVSFMSNTE